MADDADRASDLEAFNIHLALNSLRGRAVYDGPQATECEDCGEAIPKKRRLAAPGCTRCVNCQSQFERDSKAWTR